MNRRQFVTSAALGAAPLFIPRSAFGANDRPAFGIIGTGSRGRWLHGAFQKLGAQCVAVCDVYEPYLKLAQQNSPADAKAYSNHHDLLGQNGIDFVVVATPDHHHYPMLADALKARKDVYLEKPLSMSLQQSNQMVQAVKNSDRIVQIGMHRRSMKFIHHAKQVIDEGALGRISMVKAIWNWHFDMPLANSPLEGKLDWDLFQGAARKRPLEPMRFRWWRGFWDYSGGNMTDQGTHLMDVVQWMTNSGPPRSAVCQGQVTEITGAEVPNVFSAVFEYPTFLATWTLNYRTSYNFDWSIEFYGEKAAMIMDRKGLRIYRDFGLSPQPWSQGAKPELVREDPDTDKPEAHQQNFLDCIASRKQPNCTVEIGAAAVAGPHMANIAYRQGRKVTLAPDGTA